jgi:serine/threonine protein kinase
MAAPASTAAAKRKSKMMGSRVEAPKISAIRRPDQGHVGTPYDPPEFETSAAGDVWCLGMTVFEALTQRLPSDAADLATLPAPFRHIAENALVSDPSDRWSIAQVSGYLSSRNAV